MTGGEMAFLAMAVTAATVFAVVVGYFTATCTREKLAERRAAPAPAGAHAA